jgi:hypothetical protein
MPGRQGRRQAREWGRRVISDLLDSPVTQLILLAVFAALGRRFLLRPGPTPTGSGAIAMAIGIFVLAALQQLPFPVAALTRWLTLGGLIVWAYLAGAYLASYFRGTFHLHTADPVGCFAVGTWVAGTAVLANLLTVVLPAWRLLALGMAGIALGAWLGYLVLVARGYRTILASPTRLNTTGRILLVTVSTESLLLLADQLFRGQVPLLLAQALLAFGGVFYMLGLVLIVQRYGRQHGWRLADDWDNTNCILHGAMSITGLAAVDSGALPLSGVVGIWLWVAGLFVIVEGIEVVRLAARVRVYGWARGAASYHVSQWARNFTFGMFYAFTLRLHGSLAAADAGAASGLLSVQAGIIAWGPYAVLGLLLVEAALFLLGNLDLRLPTRSRKHAAEGETL